MYCTGCSLRIAWAIRTKCSIKSKIFIEKTLSQLYCDTAYKAKTL